MGCCCLLRSLQHADFGWARWYACLDAFSKRERTRTRVATLLTDGHNACARSATGPRQPSRSDQRASISSRAGRSRTRYACCDCPRPPAPSHTHARDGPRAHGPLTRIRLAGTHAIDAPIDHRMLVLVVCASQLVTLGHHNDASGLREAGRTACGFVCGSRGALATTAELGVNIIAYRCERDFHNTKACVHMLFLMRTTRSMHPFEH